MEAHVIKGMFFPSSHGCEISTINAEFDSFWLLSEEFNFFQVGLVAHHSFFSTFEK